ncbi:MAG TPA: nuclear transport factor 2 family protein [Sphingobacteriaceae bacterium]
MKKSIQLLVCSLLVSIPMICVVQAQDQKAKPKSDASMPYQASYSSKFEMGDPAKSRMVLELWKDYDDNAIDRHISWIADTAVMYMADGQMLKGRDNMVAGVKKSRSSIAQLKTTVHAWMSLRSTDRNENWVAIWGTEEDTAKDGTKTSVSLHEVWRFNKDGKVDQIMQYMMAVPPARQE